LQHLHADAVQFAGAIGAGLSNVVRHHLLVFGNSLSDGAIWEWRVAGQEEVQAAAKPVDIGANVDQVAVECLFGSR